MNNDTNTPSIVLDSVSKTFKLPHEKNSSIKGLFVNIFRNKRTFERQKVLSNISFEVKSGEFFGVIGRNGSGKSTLLKLLAGIYTADSGSLSVNGKLTPFIELGVGFNPELTGRENVYLNGALLGFSRNDMTRLYDEIVEFAELSNFMDQKLKNYSSGMQVRLAFSIAIRAKSDILLLDEVLAVGDIAFQEKCYKYFEKLKKEKATVVFISHDASAIEKFCDRVAIIDKGLLVDIGEPKDMVLQYGAIMAGDQYKKQDKTDKQISHKGSGSVTIDKVSLRTEHNRVVQSIKFGDPFKLSVKYTLNKEINEEVIIGVDIIDDQGISILGPNTAESGKHISITNNGSIEVSFKDNPLAAGEYSTTIGIFNKNASVAFDLVEDIMKFKIIGEKRHGKIYVEPIWTIIKD